MTVGSRVARRAGIAMSTVALIGMAVFSACSNQEKPAPSTTTTTTTPSATPTEKSLDPNGGNKFTPTVKAPTHSTAVPGDN